MVQRYNEKENDAIPKNKFHGSFKIFWLWELIKFKIYVGIKRVFDIINIRSF